VPGRASCRAPPPPKEAQYRTRSGCCGSVYLIYGSRSSSFSIYKSGSQNPICTIFSTTKNSFSFHISFFKGGIPSKEMEKLGKTPSKLEKYVKKIVNVSQFVVSS